MPKLTYAGQCLLCKKEMAKPEISRHLAIHKDIPGGVRLMVSDAYLPDFWLQIAVNPKAKLSMLDQFLRDIWLECCGHLSSFQINGKRYDSHFDGEALEYADSDMKVPLHTLIGKGQSFSYEYDFGSTTQLKLKVLSIEKQWSGKKPVVLMARNNLPDLKCVVCSKKATQLCIGCQWEEQENTFCTTCSKKHECKSHEDIWLPIVNSPRMGVCGYTG